MYIKTGIATFASAAILFAAGSVQASHNIEEYNKFNLSAASSLQAPLSTGHYIIETATAPQAAEAQQTMTDALPASQQLNEAVQPFSAALSQSAAQTSEKQVYVDLNRSASEILKQPLYTPQGKRVGTVHDIIISRTGDMMKIVVADGGMMSVGDKKAAFDASMLAYNRTDDQYIMNISEQDINESPDFSYDFDKASASVETIPPEGLSVKKLIGSKLVDHNDEVVADIENISFNFADAADQLIIGYDKILGMGGETAAVDFSKLRVVEDRKGTRFQLTGNQTAELRDMISSQ